MISREDAIPVLAGVADGFSDFGIDYIDKVTNSEDKPVLKRPSTLIHLGVGILGTIASMKFLKGEGRLIGTVISGRHLGEAIGKIAEAYVEKQPVLELGDEGFGNGNVNVEIMDMTPTGGIESGLEIIPPEEMTITPTSSNSSEESKEVSF